MAFLLTSFSIQICQGVSLGIQQTLQKKSVGFIPWDGITVGKDQIP
jgi:hypothetical protein